MRMSPAEARSRFEGERIARLATAGADGVPHLVPVTFVVEGDSVAFAIDHKPKSTTALRRLKNIAENPVVSFLTDHYAEDWAGLWWARADGVARVLTYPYLDEVRDTVAGAAAVKALGSRHCFNDIADCPG
ncbi:TIGR03668 family PPOX class F420-dependent oxidoreductase, partial [Amycolatopsis japonica]